MNVKYANECPPCECCEEPWCEECEEHYADCACPGPDSLCEVCEELVVACECEGGPVYAGRPLLVTG